MNKLIKLLNENEFLILDGAVATELEKKGAYLNDELWSAKVLIEQPDLITSTHLDYLRAGADIICTTTYQATFQGFAKKGINQSEARLLFEKSVQLAKDAKQAYNDESADKEIMIAASIGPYGAFLADGSEYTGDYKISQSNLIEFHRDRLECLIQNEVDLLIFETFPNKEEIVALLELLEILEHPPVLFSISCKDGTRLRDGTAIREIAQLLDHSKNIDAMGVNCIVPSLARVVLENFKNETQKPLLVYPNSGEGWDAECKTWIGGKETTANVEEWKSWLKSGAKIIGGCCRTTPNDIQSLFDFREKRKLKNFTT